MTPKQLWIGALRSGEFEQGYSKLWDYFGGNRYCCLGVAVVLFNQHHPNEPASLYGSFPETRVLHWLNLPFTEAKELAKRNDQNATFNDIADYIECNL